MNDKSINNKSINNKSMNTINIREAIECDMEAITRVMNYFILNSFAAYAEKEVPVEYMKKFMQSTRVALVLVVENQVVGFATVSPYKEHENFNHTGVLTYFILPQYTRMGLGTRLFQHLLAAAKNLGITNLVANISAKNEQSLQFHQKQGFTRCGLFKNMGKKYGELFDIVWVQKDIS
jgi:L-amino acid N-acyltransferase YncA